MVEVRLILISFLFLTGLFILFVGFRQTAPVSSDHFLPDLDSLMEFFPLEDLHVASFGDGMPFGVEDLLFFLFEERVFLGLCR